MKKMRDSVPDYVRVTGPSRRICTRTHDADRYDGIYLWSDRARAVLTGVPDALLREYEVCGGGSAGIVLPWRDTVTVTHWLRGS